jgi:hypothetical protein
MNRGDLAWIPLAIGIALLFSLGDGKCGVRGHVRSHPSTEAAR